MKKKGLVAYKGSDVSAGYPRILRLSIAEAFWDILWSILNPLMIMLVMVLVFRAFFALMSKIIRSI